MPTGSVKWFSGQKGYGFIEPDTGGNDVFVHISSVQKSRLPGLEEGQRVSFDEKANPKTGKTAAENIQVIR